MWVLVVDDGAVGKVDVVEVMIAVVVVVEEVVADLVGWVVASTLVEWGKGTDCVEEIERIVESREVVSRR